VRMERSITWTLSAMKHVPVAKRTLCWNAPRPMQFTAESTVIVWTWVVVTVGFEFRIPMVDVDGDVGS